MTNITPTGNTPNPLPTPPPGGAKKPPSKKDEMSDLARQNLPFKED